VGILFYQGIDRGGGPNTDTGIGFAEDLKAGDIVMLHYNEETDEWEGLETTLTGEDGMYYYYSTKTPSFSWFAIAVSEGSTVVPVETETAITQAATVSATSSPSPAVTVLSTPTPDNPGPTGETGSWTSLVIPAPAFVLATRRKKEQYPDWCDHDKKKLTIFYLK
jgi:hypothetical protein